MKRTKTVVILVDDDVPLLRALARLVALEGFETLAFSRPGDLLTAQIPSRGACIVLDLFMPDMDALAVFQHLRAAGNELPVILITGRQDERSQRIISQIEHAAVLYKPFAIAELLSAIANTTAKASH